VEALGDGVLAGEAPHAADLDLPSLQRAAKLPAVPEGVFLELPQAIEQPMDEDMKVFLAEMAATLPWPKLVALIEPHSPQARPAGRPRSVPARRHAAHLLLQQWYTLPDPGAEEALYDIQSMHAFAGI